MGRLSKVWAELARFRDDLGQAVAEGVELLAVKMVLAQVGWRTDRPIADDVRSLAEAWGDAERRVAALTPTDGGPPWKTRAEWAESHLCEMAEARDELGKTLDLALRLLLAGRLDVADPLWWNDPAARRRVRDQLDALIEPTGTIRAAEPVASPVEVEHQAGEAPAIHGPGIVYLDGEPAGHTRERMEDTPS